MIRRKLFIYKHLIRNWYRQRQEIRRKLDGLTDPGLLDRIK